MGFLIRCPAPPTPFGSSRRRGHPVSTHHFDQPDHDRRRACNLSGGLVCACSCWFGVSCATSPQAACVLDANSRITLERAACTNVFGSSPSTPYVAAPP